MNSLTSLIYSCKSCFLSQSELCAFLRLTRCLQKLYNFYFVPLKTFSGFLIASGIISIPLYIFSKSTLGSKRDFYYTVAVCITDKVKEKATKSMLSIVLEERDLPMQDKQPRQRQILSCGSLLGVQGLLFFSPQGEPFTKHTNDIPWSRTMVPL